jgi:lipopolysaccharide transport system ATP-binding protein
MSDIAIKVEGLSKLYRIGQREPYRTLRDSITKAFAAPIRWFQNPPSSVLHPSSDTIWALKDVSFDVKQGEVVGIIGRNGAGKSTLLKILSRITEPTKGYAEIRGRVGSLLEVGTGFHPELTGRENIYLNGAILGMSRREIEKKFDDIVAFAEVEKFIDTPVKHYSSGMYMRLAFAVAAHLDTEIVLVDEVLAVGDAAFQRKCLGKMGNVAREGRTILFVSHNMGAVNQLCQKGILLDQGEISAQGPGQEVISTYLLSVTETSGSYKTFSADPDKSMQILSVAVTNDAGQPMSMFDTRSKICLDIQYQVYRPVVGGNLAIVVSRNGTDLLSSFDTDTNPMLLTQRSPGIYRYQVHLPTQYLKAGLYSVHLDTGIINRGAIERHQDAVTFTIEEITEDTSLKGYAEHRAGVLRIPVLWEVK